MVKSVSKLNTPSPRQLIPCWSLLKQLQNPICKCCHDCFSYKYSPESALLGRTQPLHWSLRNLQRRLCGRGRGGRRRGWRTAGGKASGTSPCRSGAPSWTATARRGEVSWGHFHCFVLSIADLWKCDCNVFARLLSTFVFPPPSKVHWDDPTCVIWCCSSRPRCRREVTQ